MALPMTTRQLPLRERLRMLARHLPAFAAPGFSFGAWVPSQTAAGGVIHLGWYEPSPAAEAFLADVRAAGWVTAFDWMAWLAGPDGQALASDPAAVASAGPDELGRLLTAYVRGERFGEGTLATAFETGMLTAILRRAAALAEAEADA